jgi:hypothetical protein
MPSSRYRKMRCTFPADAVLGVLEWLSWRSKSAGEKHDLGGSRNSSTTSPYRCFPFGQAIKPPITHDAVERETVSSPRFRLWHCSREETISNRRSDQHNGYDVLHTVLPAAHGCVFREPTRVYAIPGSRCDCGLQTQRRRDPVATIPFGMFVFICSAGYLCIALATVA